MLIIGKGEEQDQKMAAIKTVTYIPLLHQVMQRVFSEIAICVLMML
jgi:hypothetical protein